MKEPKKMKYLTLAQEALRIMEMPNSADESLESMLAKMRNTFPLPASSTEREIRALSEKIADEIEQEGTISHIRKLIEKLEFEVTYLPFD